MKKLDVVFRVVLLRNLRGRTFVAKVPPDFINFYFSNRNSVSHLEVLLLLGPHSPVRSAYWPSNWIPSTKVEKNYEETRCCFPRRFFLKS